MNSPKNYNSGILLLRLMIGVLMLFHGVAKLSRGVEGISNRLAEYGIPEFLAYTVFIGEILAPVLIIIGYRTRLASLILAINMLVIVFLAHSDKIFQLTGSGAWALELIGMYFFGAVVLMITGGGKFAISRSKWWD